MPASKPGTRSGKPANGRMNSAAKPKPAPTSNGHGTKNNSASTSNGPTWTQPAPHEPPHPTAEETTHTKP